MGRKIFFLCSLLTILASCKDEDTITLDCLSPGLQNGVIAFYPFSHGSLSDESGAQHDLVNTTFASPATDRNQNASCAFQFDNTYGTDQFLVHINPAFLNNLNEFSIALWYMHTDATTTSAKYQILASRGDALHCPDRRGEYSLGLYDCTRAVFGHNNSVWAEPVTNPLMTCQDEIDTLLNTWHHVVGIMNGGTYKLYFDGVLQGTETGPADCGSGNYTAQDVGDLILGKYFTGRLDDVLIYDRELSQSEVTELYVLSGCCK
jgi:hypothetical protein